MIAPSHDFIDSKPSSRCLSKLKDIRWLHRLHILIGSCFWIAFLDHDQNQKFIQFMDIFMISDPFWLKIIVFHCIQQFYGQIARKETEKWIRSWNQILWSQFWIAFLDQVFGSHFQNMIHSKNSHFYSKFEFLTVFLTRK